MGNVSTIAEIASFLGGPSERTLHYSCQPKVEVMEHAQPQNVDCHMGQFSTHFDHRLPTGLRLGDIPCILSTDATATTGRVGVKKVGDKHFVMGLDHPYNKPVTVDLEKQDDKPDWAENQDGSHINGLESFPRLFDDNIIKRANNMNAFILVPLMQNCFTYNIVSFPIGKMLSGKDLLDAYNMIKSAALKHGIHVKSLHGMSFELYSKA